MVNRAAKPYVVFWLAEFTGNPAKRGYGTELLHARAMDFDNLEAAERIFAKLTKIAAEGGTYQSRRPSFVTKSWST